MGLPSKYRPEFDAQMIEYAKQGFLLKEIAVKFGVAHKIMWEWQAAHPSFKEAYQFSKDIILSQLERRLVDCSMDRNFNSRSIEFILMQIEKNAAHCGVKVPGISKGTVKDKINRILEAIEDEKLRSEEARNITEMLKTMQDIEYGKEALDKLEQLELKK